MKIQPNSNLFADPLNQATGKKAESSAQKLIGPGDFQAKLDAAATGVTAAVDPAEVERAGHMRPLTALDMTPGLHGPFKPMGPSVVDERPGIPPTPPLMPIDQKNDFIPGQRARATSQEDKVTAQARKWVAQTFYGTLLKQMRNSPFKSEMFDGGRGGQAFAPLLDQHLVDSMGGADKKLVTAIARKLMKGVKDTGAASGVEGAEGAGRIGQAQQPKGESEIPKDNPYKDVRTHVAPSLRA